MVSADTPMPDKMKAVSELFKKVGKKLVNSERLTPITEKKAQPQEVKGSLLKFEQVQYATLMEHLYAFAAKHVVTTRESGTCLLDCYSLQGTSQNRRLQVDACLT